MAEIILNTGETCLIDDEDIPLVQSIKYAWRYAHNGRTGDKRYVRTAIPTIKADGGKSSAWIYIHRLIMGAQKGQIIDHINCNTLDNRRCNLRFATRSINSMNQKKFEINSRGKQCSSMFRGVSIDRRSKKNPWRALIRAPGMKTHHIGQFKTEVAAAFAYDLASLRFHGEFGRRNFLPLVV